MRRFLVVTGLVLLLAACGSSGGSEGGVSSSDRKIIAAGLLRQSDLPGATQGLPLDDSSDDIEKVAKGIPECRRFVDANVESTGRRRSPRFTQDGVRSSSSADRYTSAAVAAEQLALYADPETPGCLQAVLRASLAGVASTGATIGNVTVTPLPPPAIGDGAFAYRISIPITQLGRASELVSDQVGASVGPYTVVVTSGLPAPLPLTAEQRQALVDRLTQLDAALAPKLVDRMQAAGA